MDHIFFKNWSILVLSGNPLRSKQFACYLHFPDSQTTLMALKTFKTICSVSCIFFERRSIILCCFHASVASSAFVSFCFTSFVFFFFHLLVVLLYFSFTLLNLSSRSASNAYDINRRRILQFFICSSVWNLRTSLQNFSFLLNRFCTAFKPLPMHPSVCSCR